MRSEGGLSASLFVCLCVDVNSGTTGGLLALPAASELRKPEK